MNAYIEHTLAEHRYVSRRINESDVPVSGCLAGGTRNTRYDSDEEILEKRKVWAPLRRSKPPISRHCRSHDPPFCTALSRWEAERFGPQYITLQKCSSDADGGYTVDAVSTCAVLVIGAGGLGSPVLMYLAAGGIGIIGIMDGDVVEPSNLHRQVVHDEESQGLNKAVSAKKRMTKINSQGLYIVYEKFFGQEEAHEVVPKYDIIVDATDNPQTRYLISDACLKHKKILVMASSIGSQGQLMVFNHTMVKNTPCYRCISPLEGNPFINVRRGACSFSGVIGTLPGVLGCLQATEVLKLAAGAMDAVLAPGRMLIYDTTNITRPFRCVQLKKKSSCIACGDTAGEIQLKMIPWETCTMNEAVDDSSVSCETFWKIYMERLSMGVPVKARVSIRNSILQMDTDGEEHTVLLFDVRPKEHHSLCHLSGAISWPVSDVLEDIEALMNEPKETKDRIDKIDQILLKVVGCQTQGKLLLLFICFLGNSSRVAVEALRSAIKQHGYAADVDRIKCYSIAGGCKAIRTRLGIVMPLS